MVRAQDEVDQIVLHSLRSLGCEISDDTKRISDLDQDQVFKAVVSCLFAIDENLKYPNALPNNTAKAVSLSTEIASTIKDLGFRGSIGYHNLIYPNATDTRNILVFLDETLPSKEKGGAEESAAIDLIDEHLKRLNKAMYAPHFAVKSSSSRRLYHNAVAFTTSRVHDPNSMPESKLEPTFLAEERYVGAVLPMITHQPATASNVVPSILEQNTKNITAQQEREAEWRACLDAGLNPEEYLRNKRQRVKKMMTGHVRTALASQSDTSSYGSIIEDLASNNGRGRFGKGTRFMNQVDFAEKDDAPPPLSEAELQAQRDAELETLRVKITELAQENARLTTDIQAFASTIRQLEANTVNEQNDQAALKERYQMLKKTFDLLPDAEKNIQLLRDISQQSAKRLAELAAEWEQHRVPLIDNYRKLKHQSLNKKDDTQEKLDRIKAMRAEMKELVVLIRQRDDRYKQLIELYSRMPKDINRGMYTRRIMEIVKNVKKQKVVIEKVLIDTRNQKKDIATIGDTLGRSFSVTSEEVFAVALTDETAKAIYKELASIHEKFETLATMVEKTGSSQNRIEDLHDKIEQMTLRTETLETKRILKDLKEVKKENTEMIAKIKGKKGKKDKK
eukprot:TRINITY_DN1354_c0_g1_i1.p1 TRINITY_DN1354_c0_g1~~TRINITY_DN1354_c0_g1_i1.p1  ORF type:complete len:672 (-),score=226.67 TRINITY_DN1354_c0_g1_i1:21-1880(-)